MGHDETVSPREGRAPASAPDALPALHFGALDAVDPGVHHAPERSEQVPMTPAMRAAIADDTGATFIWRALRSPAVSKGRLAALALLPLLLVLALAIPVVFIVLLTHGGADAFFVVLLIAVFGAQVYWMLIVTARALLSRNRAHSGDIQEGTITQLTGPVRLVTGMDKGYEGEARFLTEIWIGESRVLTTDDLEMRERLRTVAQAVAERTMHTGFLFEIRDAHTGAVLYRHPRYRPDEEESTRVR